MNQHLQTILNLLQQSETLNAEEKKCIADEVKEVDKTITITESKLERTEQVKKTTADLLEETIAELEQKRKAVEAQKRELEIEAALERVRTKTMAMQKSDELFEVIKKIYDELQKLGFDALVADLMIFTEDKKGYDIWLYGAYGGEGPYRTSEAFFNHPHHQGTMNSWIKGEKLRITELKDEQFTSFFKIVLDDITGLRCLSQEDKNKIFSLGHIIQTEVFTKHGCIRVGSIEKRTEEQLDVQKRFANVFDQTYTRFLDLQKAEAQAKEAKIEAALEKVRGRAMAMQNSNELAELVDTVFKELTKLDFSLTRCLIWIFDADATGATVWSANPEIGRTPNSYHIKFLDHQWHQTMIREWKARNPRTVYELKGDEKKSVDNSMLNETELQQLPEEVKAGMLQSERVLLNSSFSNFGSLQVDTLEPLSDANREIIYRFAKVFDLTYTRFNDLKQAEAQAREAQIELGLERVRARAMAMQNSEELKELVKTLFEELTRLDVKLFASLIWTCNETTFDSTVWMFHPVTREPEAYVIQFNEDPFYQEMLRAWKERNANWRYCMEGEVKIKWGKFLFSETGFSLVPQMLKDEMLKPDKVFFSASYYNYGAIQASSLEPFSEQNITILKRFGKAFDLSYTRFLDLKQAEAQAREAQIELGLERVRARAMAMHNSDELNELVKTLFEELNRLDVRLSTCMIWTCNPATLDARIWMFHPVTREPNAYDIQYNEDPFYQELLRAWKERNANWIYCLEGDVKIKWEKFLFSETGFSLLPEVVKDEMRKPDRVFFSASYYKSGAIQAAGLEPFSEQNIDILQRFSKVFDLSYTRFLDLKQAEAQAREAKIEAALERVRSRTMAMHQSTELGDVATVLFQQLRQLGGNVWTTGIGLCKPNSSVDEFWLATEGGLQPPMFVPNTEDPVHKKMYEGWKNKIDFYSEAKDGDALKAHYNYMLSVPALKPVFENIIASGFALPTWQKWHAAYFSHGYLLIITLEPYAEESVFKRFAKVFEQTYTRFLDLQKAEAQAREAQIEAALERVRSRTMAMHQSDELLNVITVLTEQLRQLGFNIDTANFNTNYRNKDWDLWMDSDGVNPTQIHVPYFDHPIFNKIIHALDKGEDFFADILNQQEKDTFLQHLFENTVLKHAPEEGKKDKLRKKGFAYSIVFSKSTSVTIGNYEPVPYTGEENGILRRFANVFEQTYTRFLDLQKAEAQAREAKIEAALERVRSRTMAMQRSDELAHTTQILFQEFKKLNPFDDHEIFDRAFISIVNTGKGVIEFWITTTEGSQIDQKFEGNIEEPIVFNRAYKAWKNHEKSLVIDLFGEELRQYFNYLKDIGLPVSAELYRGHRVNSVAFFSKGFIGITSNQLLPVEIIRLLERFAGLFDLTYTRFFDLQKAEAQAREAQIEAALERVRSRAMAMQTSEELNALIGTVFTELTKLELILTRSVIIIYEPDGYTCRWWMANSESPSQPMNFLVNYDEQPFFDAYRKGWQEGNLKWVYELEGEDKIKTDNFLFTKTELSLLPDFVIAGMRAPEKVWLSASFNNFGCLTLASLEPLPKEHFDILLRFARVFDLTYTRFNDLKQAEAQAREAQIELGLERVRARAMAMHKSDELLEAGELLYRELGKLGIASMTSGYVIMDDEEKIGWIYAASPADGTILPKPTGLPHTNTVMASIKESWKKQEPFHVVELDEQATIDHHTYLAKNSIDFLFTVEEFLAMSPERIVMHSFNFKQGYLLVVGLARLTSAQEEMLLRFTKVFEMTYRRFLDLKQAEAQAREARIEAALEKIRSRTMAMHHSDELKNVVTVVLKILEEFNLVFEGGAVIVTFTEGSKDLTYWIASDLLATASRFHFPYFDHPIVNMYAEAKENGKDFFAKVYPYEIKNSYYHYAFEHSDFKYLPDDLKNFIFGTNCIGASFALTNNAAILTPSFSGEIITEKEGELLKRFARAFEQAYIRFLDLQKAEAQAREAQIEAALERVRSRSLGMHKSDELNEVILVVFEKLKEFSVVTDGVALINLYTEGTRDVIQWIANPELMTTGCFTLPYFDHPILSIIWEARESGKDFVTHTFDFEEKNNFWNYTFQNTDYKYLSDDLKKMLLESEGYGYVVAFEKYSSILVCTYTKKKFSADGIEILKRFAKVFEQAYIRFLDLQKAEAQAREAKIESALERVRSKMMAMHQSSELKSVIQEATNQLQQLGFKVHSANFSINMNIHEDPDMHLWVGVPGEQGYFTQLDIPYFDHPMFTKTYQAIDRGEELVTDTFTPEEKKTFYEHVYEHTALKNVSDERKKMVLSAEAMARSTALSKNSALTVINYEGTSYTDEENNILKRIAKVFDQAYTRFLDLQKAEAQAREAKIEVALERVRSRAMAMQNSNELKELVKTLFEELTGLDVKLATCLIWTCNPTTSDAKLWMFHPITKEPDALVIQYNEEPFYQEMLRAWKERNANWIYCLQGDAKIRWEKLLFNETGFSLLPDVVKDEMRKPDKVFFSASYYNNGAIQAAGLESFSRQNIEIMQRFGKVFDLSYTRFLDLKQAEAQAREAVRQASLDRVRAEIASMRSTDDLQRITPIIWRELNTLQVPFLRCGVFVVDEVMGITHAYLSTPEGQPLGVLNLRINERDLTRKIVGHWRKGLVCREHWNKEQFINWMQSMIQLKQISDKEVYQGEANPPESLDLHFVPFAQGMLYVGNTEPLTDDDIQLVKSLAEAFAIAYARYEDFKQLEDAKNKMEVTLNELRTTQTQLIQSEKMASLGELTAGIAHEIQNPLNFVNNFSEVNKELIEEMKEEIDKGNMEEVKTIANDIEENEQKINHHGKRADAIVKGMLQHSRASTGKKEPTDINALADEYLRLSYHGLRAKDKSFNANFKTDFDESIGKIEIVPQDIGRVLLNLFNNAFYAVSEKKKQSGNSYEPVVSVTTKKENDKVVIIVRDNGFGIPQKIVDKIFQPFFTTKPTGQGTGLGLSLSYDIIKAHEGELKVETKEGEGAKFIIQLPEVKI